MSLPRLINLVAVSTEPATLGSKKGNGENPNKKPLLLLSWRFGARHAPSLAQDIDGGCQAGHIAAPKRGLIPRMQKALESFRGWLLS